MHVVGIDFGTTNSAVAVYFPETDQVVVGEYEPTVIFFEESNQPIYHIGQQAVRKYVESGMQGRFIRSIKSVLHRKSFKQTYINGKRYYAEDLVGLYLDFLAEKAARIIGERPTKVVLGRPARFSPDPEADELAQTRLLKAAEIAGFTDITFQMEPIAAAFSYEHQITQPELVFVGDFGGGTADFTLMQLGPDRDDRDRLEDIVGTNGVRVGGDDFDAELAWGKVVQHLGLGLQYDSTGRGKLLPIPPHHYRTFCRWENHFQLNTHQTVLEIEKFHRWTHFHPQIGDFLKIIQQNLGYSLFRSIEGAKIALSAQATASIEFDQAGIQIHETVAQPEFARYITRQMKKLNETIVGLLEQTQVDPGVVDAVFLTGGSSAVIPVREVIASVFGKEKIRENDAFTSVARGLALHSKFAVG